MLPSVIPLYFLASLHSTPNGPEPEHEDGLRDVRKSNKKGIPRTRFKERNREVRICTIVFGKTEGFGKIETFN